MKTTAATLQKALDILEENGRTRGSYHNDDGEYCMMGALEAAVGDLPTRLRYKRMDRALKAFKNHANLRSSIIVCNDRKCRTFASVRSALKKAISAELGE